MEEIKKLMIAKKHKTFNAQSQLHKKFLEQQLVKTKCLQTEHPYLDLKKEIEYFGS